MNKSNTHYRFFTNRQCECFPCHSGIAEEDFNCLFCYCPLYALGRKCGGNYRYNDRGTKVCSDCAFPHLAESFDGILARYRDIAAVVARIDEEDICGGRGEEASKA